MSDGLMNAASAAQAAARVMARCDRLAEISETPGMLTRVYLSPEHMQANALVGEWMREAGMRVWQDSVGNICGRYEGLETGAQALLLGSHLDTVRNAGRYDGMLGVLTAIETVQALHQQQQRLPLAIEIVGFGDEEGTRFGITLLGSRGITGTWPESWVTHPDGNSITVAQAMADIGLDGEKIQQAARDVSEIVAYLELHIEQGPCLEQEDLALGVVTAINGARRLNCQFVGESRSCRHGADVAPQRRAGGGGRMDGVYRADHAETQPSVGGDGGHASVFTWRRKRGFRATLP